MLCAALVLPTLEVYLFKKTQTITLYFLQQQTHAVRFFGFLFKMSGLWIRFEKLAFLFFFSLLPYFRKKKRKEVCWISLLTVCLCLPLKLLGNN
jgi:hypothetical protein